MRNQIFLLGLLLSSTSALAQVTVDPRALDTLQPAKPSSARPSPAKPATPPSIQHQTPAKPSAAHAVPTPPPTNSTPSTGVTVRPNPGTAGQPSVPATPPAGVIIPPPIAVPTRPTPAPTPPAISADSPSTTSPLTGGLRVVFGSGRGDINPAVDAAIRGLTRGTGPVAPDATSYTVTTYAAGTPEDPSTPRRLSLSRALTVRSVLISQGIPSVRIFVKALGPNSPGFGDGPPDRADIVVALNPIPAANGLAGSAPPENSRSATTPATLVKPH